MKYEIKKSESNIRIATITARCIAIGKDPKGRLKLMIYLPRESIDYLKLEKGSVLGGQLFNMVGVKGKEKGDNKQGTKNLCSVNPNNTNQVVQPDGTNEIDLDELTEPEKDFLKKYKESNETEKTFLETKGFSSFGKERTKELIEMSK